MKKCMIGIIAFLYSSLCANLFFAVANTWTPKADLGKTGRSGAVGFSIGSKGYIGTGWNGISYSFHKDFWEYDPADNKWTPKADFGGAERLNAVGFSIGTKGYIGTGALSPGSPHAKDFWEYDPADDKWTPKADFGGSGRYQSVGFSIGTKGYIGTGIIAFSGLNDFWEYDPADNKWIQKADFGGGARYVAVGFSIGSKGYVGTGYNSLNPNDDKDFWEYDPADDKWTRKDDFVGTARTLATSFSIGTKGYIGTGSFWDGSSSNYCKDFWEYNPVPPPDVLIKQIINTVTSFELTKAVENSYMANIKKVGDFINDGKVIPAVNQLNATVRKVKTDMEKGSINEADGNQLIIMLTFLSNELNP